MDKYLIITSCCSPTKWSNEPSEHMYHSNIVFNKSNNFNEMIDKFKHEHNNGHFMNLVNLLSSNEYTKCNNLRYFKTLQNWSFQYINRYHLQGKPLYYIIAPNNIDYFCNIKLPDEENIYLLQNKTIKIVDDEYLNQIENNSIYISLEYPFLNKKKIGEIAIFWYNHTLSKFNSYYLQEKYSKTSQYLFNIYKLGDLREDYNLYTFINTQVQENILESFGKPDSLNNLKCSDYLVLMCDKDKIIHSFYLINNYKNYNIYTVNTLKKYRGQDIFTNCYQYLLKYLKNNNINKKIQLQIELDKLYDIKNRLRLYYRNGFELCEIINYHSGIYYLTMSN